MGLEYSDKTSCFEPKLFSKVSKNVFRGAMKTNKNSCESEMIDFQTH